MFCVFHLLGLKQTFIIIACLSYSIIAIVFCISFYRGSASIYAIITSWTYLQTGWLRSVQILYCSFAIFSALMVFMFLIPRTFNEISIFSIVVCALFAFLKNSFAHNRLYVAAKGKHVRLSFWMACYCGVNWYSYIHNIYVYLSLQICNCK